MNLAWPWAPLGEVCEVLDRQRKPITKKDRVPGPYPYYGATGVLDHVESYIFDEDLVLVGEDGAKWESGEKSAFSIRGKAWVNNHAHVLRPRRDRILDGWLIYYLNHSDLTPFITGLTVPKLNQGRLREITVPAPSLSEQGRIVAILDEAMAAIDTATHNTQQNLTNAEETFTTGLDERISQDHAGIDSVPFQSVLSVQPRNGWSPPASARSSEGTPVLTLSSVTGFRFDGSRVKYVDIETDPGAHYWLVPNDLLMTRSNTPKLVGHVAVFDGKPSNVIYPDLIMRMRPDPEMMLTRYAYYVLRTRTVRDYLTGNAGGASQTMSKITKRVVQDLPISVPELDAQAESVAYLDSLANSTTELGNRYAAKLLAFDTLRQSLLHKAFSGELTGDSETVDQLLSGAAV